jgi:serine/threonine protein kinase/tetratricopeptide (TPR) repeat protein
LALVPGARLGAYEVLTLIGSGGMGEVYRAHDTKLGRDVALKVLPESLANDSGRLTRFGREARVLAALNHPNIAHIHGFEDSTGVPALVMELVEGQTLADRIARGPIPIGEALPIARQIADALEGAHDLGIIHRDLKPANVKVRDDGTVKVLDFGLAKALDPLAASSAAAALANSPTMTTPGAMTAAGIILGTAAYMAPEQARGKPVDRCADVWAFGCVLYEMLTGRRAFRGETVSDTIAGILEREPDWRALPTDTPTAVRRLLKRCLEKDSKRRLHDIADARLEIDEVDAPEHDVSRAALPQKPWMPRTIAGSLIVLLLGAVVAALVVDRFTQRTASVLPSHTTQDAGSLRLIVLPFENLSRQPADEWLAGAFSDSLTLGLRDAENITIVDRERLLEVTQSRHPDPQQVARGLGVRYYVSGSYQRVADDLKVVARLVEVDAGTIKLQETFTDRFANLLHIEDDLARRFATALQESPSAATHVRTASLVAYQAVAQANDLYLTGRYREATERLESAIAQDEKYGDAWALLGKSYARLGGPNNMDGSVRAGFLREALRASQRAIELAPSLYDAHIALAATYQQLEQVESWRIAAQKAIDLNPRLAEAYVLIGDSYSGSPAYGCSRKRDPELAERAFRKALQLNPYFGFARERLISYLFWAGREDEALRAADEALRLLPDHAAFRMMRATALVWLGRGDDLEQQLRGIATSAPSSVIYEWFLAAVTLLHGHVEEAAGQFKPVIARGPLTLREIDTGRLYANVGRMTDAAAHLQRAFAFDASCAVFVDESPAFAAYRNEPVLRTLLWKYLPTRSDKSTPPADGHTLRAKQKGSG